MEKGINISENVNIPHILMLPLNTDLVQEGRLAKRCEMMFYVGGRKNVFLAAVQVRAVSLPLPLHCALFLRALSLPSHIWSLSAAS